MAATRIRGGLAIVLGAAASFVACGGSHPGGAGGPPRVEPNMAPPESTPAQQSAVAFFDDSVVHEVRLWMSDDDFKSIIEDSRGDDLRNATFSIDGVVMANIGVRPSGESSRVPGNQKMSMRISFDGFDKGKKMGGVDEVKLSGSWDDPFIVRDRLAYWVYRQVMPAPRETAAQVWVNGQPRGVFEIEEVWGKEALAAHFPDPTGAMYRLRGLTNTDPYAYKGDDPAAYVPLPWDPVGRSMLDPVTDTVIGPALAVVAAGPDHLGDAMDVDTLLTYFAASAILSNTDGFTGPFEVDDHYQYHDPSTGKFFILPWDPDNTFGSINDAPDADIFLNYQRCVIPRMISEGALQEPFFAKLEDVMNRVPAQAIKDQADAIVAQIGDAATYDTVKMYPTESFIWSLGYVKGWIDARYASIPTQIATKRAGGTTGTDTGTGGTAGTMGTAGTAGTTGTAGTGGAQ
jgi:spore coat protein CotH